MRKYSLADIDPDVLTQRWKKDRRALRRCNTAHKKLERMRISETCGYFQLPYYVKREVYQRHYEPVFIEEHIVENHAITINPDTGSIQIKVTNTEIVPAHWSKQLVDFKTVPIKPYLKQYTRTPARAPYKRLAARKERYLHYSVAPSAKGSHRRVAEVDWLAW